MKIAVKFGLNQLEKGVYTEGGGEDKILFLIVASYRAALCGCPTGCKGSHIGLPLLNQLIGLKTCNKLKLAKNMYNKVME